MRKRKKILFTVLLILVLIPTAAVLVVQIPSVQTKICQSITSIISGRIDGDISLSNVYYALPDRLIIKGAKITDDNGDVVFASDKISVAVEIMPFIRENKFIITKAGLSKGEFNFITDTDGSTNIAKAFSGLSKSPEEPQSEEEINPASENITENENALEAETDSTTSALEIHLKRFSIEDFSFNMVDKESIAEESEGRKSSKAMQYDDLHISGINLDAKNVTYDVNGLSADLEKLSAKESRGFNLHNLSGAVTVSEGLINIDNLSIIDDYSDVRANYFSMTYEEANAFSDFLNKVSLGIDLTDAVLDFRTLHFFTSGIDFLTLCLTLNGEVTGPVANLKSDKLEAQTETGRTSLDLSCHISGLPEILETMVGISIKKCNTTTGDIEHIINQVTSKPLKRGTVADILPSERVSFTGTLNGFFTDFVAFGQLDTRNSGSVDVDAIMRLDDITEDYEIIGNFDGESIALGKILNSDKIGDLTFDGSIAGTTGPSGDHLELESLTIRDIFFNDYNYRDIIARGLLDDTRFNGYVISEDPNLNFDFHGEIGLPKQDEDAIYNFNFNLNNADLYALHFDEREIARVQLEATADFVRKPSNDFFGDIIISNFHTELENERFDIGDISVRSLWADSNYRLDVKSSLLTARFRGSSTPTAFATDIINLLAKNELTNLTGQAYQEIDSTHNFAIDINTLDLRPVCEFFVPGLYISNGSNINGKISDGQAFAAIKSELIALKDTYIKNLALDVENTNEATDADIAIESLEIGNIVSNGNKISLALDNNVIGIDIEAMNVSDSTSSVSLRSEIEFLDTLQSPDIFIAKFYKSDIILNSDKWTISPSELSYRDKHIAINQFAIRNGDQALEVDGTLSENPSDTAQIRMNKFNLGILNPFLSESMALGGELSGKGELLGYLGSEKGLLLNINGQDIKLSGEDIGSLKVESNWDDDTQSYKINLDNKLGEVRPIQLTGSFRPSDKNVNINARIDKLNAALFNSLASGIVSDLKGSLSTTVRLQGPLDNLTITSRNNRINNLGFVLDYTRVPYILDGTFSLTEQGFNLNNATIKDTYGHTGTASGGIDLKNIKKPELNLALNINNILGLNTSLSDNSSFFGRAFGTGTVTLKGPFSKLALDIDVTTNQNSSIHIPLGSAASAKTSILTFTNNLQSIQSVYDSLVTHNALMKESGSSLDVRIRIDATPDAEIQLDINESVGDAIKARGSGLIDMTATADVFDIKGVYNINEGSYRLVLLGLASRDFNIEQGGTINFNGDIMQSDLNLTANYRTKALMSTLVPEMTTRRNVDCNIGISGKLANPELSFDIQIPDLDPTTQSIVESTMNTEEKRLKQMLTLLISGGFMPDEQSGIVNNTTVLFSNASEIMSNQLNNVFRQLEIPLDLGFNYQPGENGRDIFDVAISTQLFNNRVTINGNIGNSQYLGASKSDIVGDIDMEIKLTQSGKMRLTLFSHSADQYSVYLDQTQRNGAGIAYQEEFDTFKELWQKIFWSKERQEAEALKEDTEESGSRINFIN